jgi:ABC-type uncharacterized transport system substrate-binding protein
MLSRRAARALRRHGRAPGDAVAAGLVASLARPGGNVTGLTDALPELMAKWLELLKETVPRTERVAWVGSAIPCSPLELIVDFLRSLGCRLAPVGFAVKM